MRREFNIKIRRPAEKSAFHSIISKKVFDTIIAEFKHFEVVVPGIQSLVWFGPIISTIKSVQSIVLKPADRIGEVFSSVLAKQEVSLSTGLVANYKKYTITGEWEVYPSSNYDDIVFGNPDFCYVMGQPSFQRFSDTQPKFNFSQGAVSKSLERDLGTRMWVANSDSIMRNAKQGYYDHYVSLSKATRGFFDAYWDLEGTIYSIRRKGDACGTYVETVKAPIGSYPNNGVKDGYWWVREGYEQFDNKALNKGELMDLAGWTTTGFIRVPKGCTNITIETGAASGDHDCLCEYDANRNYLSYWGAGANPRTFSFDYPEDIRYIRATFLTSKLADCYIYDNNNQQYIWKSSAQHFQVTNLLSGDSMMREGSVVGSQDNFIFTGSYAMITQTLPTPIAGHLYYGRVDQNVPAGTTFGDGRFEYFGGDGEGKNIVFTSFMDATKDGYWHTYSAIVSFPYISGSNWVMRSFAVENTEWAQRRRHMIIDLTAAFGTGKEPTKEWCDTYIPFFEGTTDIVI